MGAQPRWGWWRAGVGGRVYQHPQEDMGSGQQATGAPQWLALAGQCGKRGQRQSPAQLRDATERLSRGLCEEGHLLARRRPFSLGSHLTN